MSRQPNPDNLVISDAIMWALEDGAVHSSVDITRTIGAEPGGRRWWVLPHDPRHLPSYQAEGTEPGPYREAWITAQLQRLINRGDVVRFPGNGVTVGYRRADGGTDRELLDQLEEKVK